MGSPDSIQSSLVNPWLTISQRQPPNQADKQQALGQALSIPHIIAILKRQDIPFPRIWQPYDTRISVANIGWSNLTAQCPATRYHRSQDRTIALEGAEANRWLQRVGRSNRSQGNSQTMIQQHRLIIQDCRASVHCWSPRTYLETTF